MVTFKAFIKREEIPKLVLDLKHEKLEISLSEDNPNEIKDVFNSLIKILKKGKYVFTLDDEKDDLYKNICEEYLNQLNSELAYVYSQLKVHGLTENPVISSPKEESDCDLPL